ncbi:MAG: hypothetical protein IMZ64_09005 [Bacteroidetes bacterium]|nr:hypothetical protein [Bacteroidota bacterium]
MQLIKEVDFKPLDKLIVTFDKFRTYSTDYQVVDNEAMPEAPAKDDVQDGVGIPKMKVIKNKVKYNQQVARVVAVPKAEADISVGDELMVDFRACFKLDGYKDLYLIPKYNVIGIMDSSIIEK